MFVWFALGFIAGIFGLFLVAELPAFLAVFYTFKLSSLSFTDFTPFLLIIFSLVLGVLLLARFKLVRLANFLAGLSFSLGVFVVHLALAADLPAKNLWVNQHAVAQVEVVGLPEVIDAKFGKLVRFEARLQKLKFNEAEWDLPNPLIRLNCYRCNDFVPQAGEIWQLPVKLKPIYGMMNPGGFDYEAWAFQKGLRASGYITDISKAELTSSQTSFGSFREDFATKVAPSWKGSEFKGIYAALIYGDISGITLEQWEVLRVTGTIHLVAISGLHLAIIAGLAFLIAGYIWRLYPGFTPLPRQVFATFFALILASIYLVLAGFAIPTQRAWLMLGVGGLVLLLFRKPQAWSALLLAALVILVVQPASVLAQGFWLSFLAVAWIFITLNFAWVKQRKTWQQVVIVQVVLSLGLMPALWWFQQQLPLYGVLANLVAVPFVSFFALPALFVYLVVLAVSSSLAEILLNIFDFSWSGVWWFLDYLASLPFANWTLRPIALWQVVLIYLGLFSWLLIKQAWRYVGLAVFVLAMAFPYKANNPQFGEFDLTLLDVGQGQALVIETQNHVLVYDAGPKFGPKLSGASVGITPYLKFKARGFIDHLMISHADMDHAGGVDELLRDWQIGELTTGEVERLAKDNFTSCHDLEAWEWDGVRFELLDVLQFNPTKSNDLSCVLKVTPKGSSAGRGVIITGDLDSRFERHLVYKYAENLHADLLVAGHHGSKYSTSQEFLTVINPQIVLFSSGWLNRFGFPTKETVGRVEEQEAEWFNTACSGAITVRFNQSGVELINQQRMTSQKWFHNECSF